MRQFLSSFLTPDLTRSIGKATGLDERYVAQILHAVFLAPDIVDAILDSQHPVGLTMEKLRKRPPVDWQEQRTRLGFTLPAGIAEKKTFMSDAQRLFHQLNRQYLHAGTAGEIRPPPIEVWTFDVGNEAACCAQSDSSCGSGCVMVT